MSYGDNFFVVGIGASAGGLDAVQQFFNNISDESGIAFVVVQHLSPDFKSLMPELLAKNTKMKIYTASNNLKIKPNCIYLNQRNKNLIVKDGKLLLIDKAPKDHLNLPIDLFFHSLGESFKERSIGVILSGTGSDGSRGIKTIKETGGTILVQDPETAQFNGMPNSAINTNLPDFILSPQGLAERIVLFTQKRLDNLPTITKEAEYDEIYKLILAEVHNYSGINFRKYKNNTLLRRLEKRMSLHNFNSLKEYYDFLKEDEKEKSALKQDFLIGVTNFFRDNEAFSLVRNKVVPTVCQSKKTNDNIRIWVPGCSTGEEAYSLAILFDRFIRDTKSNIDFKIFATDIDKKSLLKASMGSYPINNFAEIDKEFFEDYFFKTGDQIQIIKRIREKIVFSQHDLTSDPPFIRMDLISCRNLLIYFTATTQQSIINTFQYSLNKNGFLFLGSSESLGSNGRHFNIIDSKWKIFQNINENFRSLQHEQKDEEHYIDRYNPSQDVLLPNTRNKLALPINEGSFYRYLSKKHSPVSVFIKKDFSILFIQGDFKKWLSQNDGVYKNNLLDMLGAELASIVRNGIRQVIEKRKSLSIENLLCTVGDEQIHTDLFFEIAKGLDISEEIFLVQFGNSVHEKSEEQIILKDNDLSEFSRQRIDDLEYELKEKKDELQNAIEELEASNEELQSSNEELMSSNEELQSSNEELQSVNEELYTVNTEFQEKNKELENLNNDITNLLNSIEIGTLFLDTNLNIRKFTPEIKRIFKLEDSDIGRSINSFASCFSDNARQSIISDTKSALENLISFEKEINDNEGNWYLKRIKPFITSDKKIEGVLITFININALKKTSLKLSESEKRLSAALEVGKIAWWEVELPTGNIAFSRNKATMLGHIPEHFKDYRDFMNLIHPDDYENTMNIFNDHITGKKELYDCEYRIRNNKNDYIWFHDVGKVIYSKGERIILAGIVADISGRKQAEISLKEAIKKAESANIYKNQFLANMSHEIRTPMNGLLGFASLLKDDSLDPETKALYISFIESSSNQLLNLINDIIEVSKIEAGELNISISNCNLTKLFSEIEATFNEIKKRKNKNHIDIVPHIPAEYEKLVIKTDPARLQQVIVNLISNSIKFTEKGRIDFGFKIEKNNLVVYVKDTGIGMPDDKLGIIFNRFQRLEHEDNMIYDGTGLGLAISKGIINLLGGKISVESKLNTGTTFTFSIPFIKSESDTENGNNKNIILSNNIDDLRNLSILVAEDESINIYYLKEILNKLKVKAFWAENGHDSITVYKNNKIDVVLMDIRMPGMDGYQAATEIWKINPKAKIIAQTAYAMSSDLQKCLDFGFSDYISKPIKKEELLSVLLKCKDK